MFTFPITIRTCHGIADNTEEIWGGDTGTVRRTKGSTRLGLLDGRSTRELDGNCSSRTESHQLTAAAPLRGRGAHHGAAGLHLGGGKGG